MPRDDYYDRPRARRAYEPEDDYDDRPRGPRRKTSGSAAHVLGAVSLALGLLSLATSFGCGAIGIAPGVIGLGLGIIGFLVAHQSRRRQSLILPILGSAVSAAAVIASIVALVWFVQSVQQLEKDFQAEMAKEAQAEAEREAERATAAAEVAAADAAERAVRVTARQFYLTWEEDEDRFNALFKNKVIEVTGVFDEVDLAIEDGYAVLLKAGQEADTVDCVFEKTPEVRARLLQLKPGQTVTIRGKCLGGEPTLDACVLVK
jgi:tRNA_anti-like